jgi:tetratricopeptide (TPR) repeat protein
LRFDIDGLEKARALNAFREIEISTQINLVLDYTYLGRLDQAQACLEESQKDIDRPEFGVHLWRWSTRLADAQARLMLALGDNGRAEECILDLFRWAERTHARKYLARGLELRACLHQARGEFLKAAVDLDAAIRQADGMCYYPVRLNSRDMLLWLYEKLDRPESAVRLGSEIYTLLADLQASIHHPDLQRSFQRGLAQTAHNNRG